MPPHACLLSCTGKTQSLLQKMGVAFGGLAWLSLLTTATALCYPAVRGHLSCVARVNPAMARLGKPTAVVDVDGTAPDDWYADIKGWGVPPPWRRQLDELIATLSYDGWQDDVAAAAACCLADTKGVKWNRRILRREMRRMRHKQQVHDNRLT